MNVLSCQVSTQYKMDSPFIGIKFLAFVIKELNERGDVEVVEIDFIDNDRLKFALNAALPKGALAASVFSTGVVADSAGAIAEAALVVGGAKAIVWILTLPSSAG